MAQTPAVGPPAGAAAVTAPPLRGVYLPGSWPGEGGDVDPDGVTAEAMARLMRAPLSLAAHDLACLADGEPRRGYVIYLVQSLCREPNVRVARAGDWSSFGDRTVLAKRHLWSRLPDLDRHLRYAAFAERSLPVLRRVRANTVAATCPCWPGSQALSPLQPWYSVWPGWCCTVGRSAWPQRGKWPASRRSGPT